MAPDAYKEMITRASAGDVVYTAAVSGVPANFLGPSLTAAGLTEDLKKDRKVDFGKELDTEAKAWKTIWSAGQGVGTIHDTLTVADLVARLKAEFREAVVAQQELLNYFPK
jgi:nitronate monooxygenase